MLSAWHHVCLLHLIPLAGPSLTAHSLWRLSSLMACSRHLLPPHPYLLRTARPPQPSSPVAPGVHHPSVRLQHAPGLLRGLFAAACRPLCQPVPARAPSHSLQAARVAPDACVSSCLLLGSRSALLCNPARRLLRRRPLAWIKGLPGGGREEQSQVCAPLIVHMGNHMKPGRTVQHAWRVFSKAAANPAQAANWQAGCSS